jgi:hypothetical protein
MSSYASCTYRTPNANVSVMKRKFVNESWTFRAPLHIVLRIHVSKLGKPYLNGRGTNRGWTSPTCTDQRTQFQKMFCVTGSCSSKPSTTIALCVVYVFIPLSSWLRTALTEQMNAMNHGRPVLWATAIAAHGRQVKASLAAFVVVVRRKRNRKMSSCVSLYGRTYSKYYLLLQFRLK